MVVANNELTATKNADKSLAISMAMAMQRYNARCIARWSTSRASLKASGITWSHRYTPLGNVPRIVCPRWHGCRNRHQIRYILYNRVANKWTNSITVNGFSYIAASTTTPPDPFGRGYGRPIRRIHWSHAVWGANGTTMVVMFVIVVFVVNGIFRTIPTVESYLSC